MESQEHGAVIRYMPRHEGSVSCRKTRKHVSITEDPVQFFLDCLFALLAIVPCKFHPCVRDWNELR